MSIQRIFLSLILVPFGLAATPGTSFGQDDELLMEENPVEAKQYLDSLSRENFVRRDELTQSIEELRNELRTLELRTDTYLFERLWEDRSDVRSNNTMYRNATGFPIEMVVSVWDGGGGNQDCLLNIFINGNHVLKDDQRHEKWRTICSGTVTIPPDATYKIQADIHAKTSEKHLMQIKWFELRVDRVSINDK